MSCAITQGRQEPCLGTVGGIKAFYALNFLEDAFTVSAGEATAIDAGVTEVFKYDLEGDTNNDFQETETVDRATGTALNEQVLTLMLKKLSPKSSVELSLLVKSRAIIVVQDNMDNYRIMGLKRGVSGTVNPVTGTSLSDANGYNITLNGKEDALAPFLDSSTITALEALVSATNIDDI